MTIENVQTCWKKTTSKYDNNRRQIKKDIFVIAMIMLVSSSSITANNLVFASADLPCIDLSVVDLSKIDYSKVDWSQVNINTSNVDLSCTDWLKIDFSEIDWSQVDWGKIKGKFMIDPSIDVSKIDVSKIDVSKIDVSKIDVSKIDVSKIDVSHYDSFQIGTRSIALGTILVAGVAFGTIVVAGVAFGIGFALGYIMGRDDGENSKPELPTPKPRPPPKSYNISAPLAFVLDPYDKIEHTAVWPDQCKLWNTESSPNKDNLWMFNAYHYEEVCINLKMTGGYVLFIDFNDNDTIDGCVELLCNFYKGDQRLTTYQILDNEITNADDDEWFSITDPLFSKAKAWKPSENTIYTMDELNIMGFHIRDYWMVQDDYMLLGQYSDCKYTENSAYWDAIENGWECTQLAMHHMRIVAFDSHGVVLNDGLFMPSYDFVFGYWDPEQVANTKIVDPTGK